MENDIIEIKDKFIVDDSHSRIRGFVSAYDEQGNRIFLKENMIVEKGRELILKSLKGELSKPLFYIENKTIDNKTVEVASNLTGFISSDSKVTTPTMLYKDIKNSSLPISDVKLNSEKSGEDEKIICFELFVKADSGIQTNRWCSLGLVYEKNTDEHILFSRVTFPPYSQTANIKVYYYIYF